MVGIDNLEDGGLIRCWIPVAFPQYYSEETSTLEICLNRTAIFII